MYDATDVGDVAGSFLAEADVLGLYPPNAAAAASAVTMTSSGKWGQDWIDD
jgi:hypothetical protein